MEGNRVDKTKLEINHNIRLTSAEVASLWTAYQNNTLAICVIKHILKGMEDIEIKPVFEFALQLATTQIETITGIFAN